MCVLWYYPYVCSQVLPICVFSGTTHMCVPGYYPYVCSKCALGFYPYVCSRVLPICYILPSWIVSLAEIRPRVVKIEVTPPVEDSQNVHEPEEKVPVVVEIPTVDSKLMTDFFSTRSVATTPETRVDVTLDDFDHIFLNSNDV